MTYPTVPDTALLGDVDLHIKALAFAADAKMGTGLLFVPVSGSYPVNANGDINVTPNLGGRLAAGALVQPSGSQLVYGQKDYNDYGYLIGLTRVNVFPINYAPGPNLMWYACRTSVWRGSSSTATTQWYGSQRVKEGTNVGVRGIAWAVR